MRHFVLLFFLGLSTLYSKQQISFDDIDIIEVAKFQSVISESILEKYLYQESLDLPIEIEEEKILFQKNLDLLLEYAKKYDPEMFKLVSNELDTWTEFKTIIEQPISESNVEKIIAVSINLFNRNEEVANFSNTAIFKKIEESQNY